MSSLSFKIMECLDKNKHTMPDGLYITLANLLLENYNNTEYKLINILYIINKIKNKDGKIYINTVINNKKVYYKQSSPALEMNDVINFVNINGIHIVTKCINYEIDNKILNDSNTIEYNKYIFIREI
jgi:hypothetical protein